MEENLNYFSILPLEELAVRRMAVVLVNRPDVLERIEHFPFETGIWFERQQIQTLGRKFKDIVSQLPLPTSLMKEMTPILKAGASEIFKWKLVHGRYLSVNDECVVKKLCWTTAGAIDYRKTSESLVRSEVFPILQRFELACLYCLGDCIPALWNELSEIDKQIFFDGSDPLQDDAPDLPLFLPHILRRNSLRDCCTAEVIRQDCLKYSILYGNKFTTEYCFSKLSEDKRKAALIQSTQFAIEKYQTVSVNQPDVLRYLLSLMTSEEQLRIFRKCPCEVLLSFFDWPWQDLCLDIADLVWTFIPQSRYCWFLYMIKLHIRRRGYYIPYFIQEFFRRSPAKFRNHLLDEEYQNVFFFTEFFLAGDSNSIRAIFGDMDNSDKEKLLFSRGFSTLFDDFLLKDKWRVVEGHIRKPKLSQEVRDELKTAFVESMRVSDCGIRNRDCEFDSRKNNLKKFFEFLGGMNANTTKEASSS